MLNSSKCKGCSVSVNIPKEEINQALNILKENNKQIADDKTYKFRLAQCEDCEFFEYGTTCLKCGCIVQIRAKLANASCPYNQNPKW